MAGRRSTRERKVVIGADMNLDFLKPHVDVGLVTGDAPKARAFYADTLGLRPLASRSLGGGLQQHRFLIGAQVIKLIETPAPPPRFPGGIASANGYRLLELAVDDVEVCAEASDPDGNAIELVQHDQANGDDRVQIGLTVSNLERACDFYGHVLGLTERPSATPPAGMTGRVFAAGQSTLKLCSSDESRPTRTGPPQSAVGIRYVTFAVRGIANLAKELERRGARIAMPPREVGGIVRIMFVEDPDGNWIEFGEPIGPDAASAG